MKKTALIAASAVVIYTSVMAQGLKVLEFQGGYLSPKGTKAGVIFSGNYGVSIDEQVDLSVGLSYFHKGYSKETTSDKIYTGTGTQIGTKTQAIEYSTSLLPIMANVVVHIPFQPPWGWYLGGSLGYEFLFDKYTNNETKTSEKTNFSGFGWMMRAGMEWAIGSRSSIVAEAFYNKCKVKGDTKEVQGIPTWNEVDLSGLGFRAGFRVELY